MVKRKWPPSGVYVQAARLQLLAGLSYRFEVFAELATNLVLMATAAFLWLTAYRTPTRVSGLDRTDMVVYAILSSCLGALFVPAVQNTIHDRIRLGEIAIDLIRPVNPLLFWFAEDVGALVGRLLTQLPILLLVGWTTFGLLPLPDRAEAALFVVSCILSFLILWLLSALSGLVTFWMSGFGNMGYVKNELVRALSGSLVPLWFFPPVIQMASVWLPFQYTYQTPLSLFLGRNGYTGALYSLALQAAWVTVLGFCTGILWRMGRRRALVHGG